jgi:hypothetical protein
MVLQSRRCGKLVQLVSAPPLPLRAEEASGTMTRLQNIRTLSCDFI